MIPSTEWVGEVDTVEPVGDMGDDEPSECRRDRVWLDRDWLIDMMGFKSRVVSRLVGAAGLGLVSTLLGVQIIREVGFELTTLTKTPGLRLSISDDVVLGCIFLIAYCAELG